MSDKNALSRYISLILRHHPEAAGIELDEHGWANVDELIAGINKTRKIDFSMLEAIVAEDKKGRYSFSDDKKLIRANQGHSVNVDVELEELEPPEILYHGTGEKFTAKIDAEGLKHGTRLYVHLSGDIDTAKKVVELETGRAIFGRDEITSENLKDAILDILENPKYQENLGRIQKDMQEHGGPENAAKAALNWLDKQK